MKFELENMKVASFQLDSIDWGLEDDSESFWETALSKATFKHSGASEFIFYVGFPSRTELENFYIFEGFKEHKKFLDVCCAAWEQGFSYVCLFS